MREAIRGYADSRLEQAAADGSAGTVAGEIGAFDALLGSSADLRRVLGDPGVAAPARRAILTDLLRGRVDDTTLALLKYPVDADRATDYRSDVAWLTRRAEAAAAGEVAVTEVVLGRTAAAERIEGYATAILEDVSGGDALDNVEDELFRFMRVVDGTTDLRLALTSREVPAPARRAVVVALLGAKAHPGTVRLAAYATQVGRPRDYLEQLDRLVERIAAERDRRLAEVVSAVELDADQRTRLADALSRVSGRPTEVRITVDPAILGGFVATMGDTVVDASVRHRLNLIKERLSMPEATITTGDPR
ncbi:MAG: F0F1 ATP synthase subunit delta [Acidimicrobiales bacterium]